jgi:hypothetical protein
MIIMNKLILFPILIGAIAVILTSFILIPNDTSETKPELVLNTGFTYYDIETIQKTLAQKNVTVSAPTAITDHTVKQYCTFFDKGLPRTVDYCTTTAVMDSEGNTLGNINMGGDTNSPIMAVANLETLTLESNREDVFAVFETMIETLVCDCWEEEQSKDFESISAWIDAVQTFYYDSDKRNIKSKIDNLGNAEIFLEITTKDNSVLQTLIILK